MPLSGCENCQFEGNTIQVQEEPVQSVKLTSPLCFENRDYEFEFRFRSDYDPDQERPIIHRLTDVENSFRTVGKSVRGVLNFGNNVGWFRLGLRYRHIKQLESELISFRVFPTKMDMESDLKQIGDVIDRTYPLWRFTLAQKTDAQMARSRKRHEQFELLWIAQFKSMADELTSAMKLICRSPHSRLLPVIRMMTAERISGRVSGKLEERIKENLQCRQYDKKYRIEKSRLSFDTPENRFAKMILNYSVRRINHFSLRTRKLQKLPEQARLSESFFKELENLRTPFEKLSAQPLFREIGKYDGRMRESLVLHHRAGYAKVYRIWQELKLYLDFFGSDASVSVRSVEQPYEIWCLLEIRRMLLALGFEELKSTGYSLKTVNFEKQLNRADEKFQFQRKDGVEAVLIHEPTYSGWKQMAVDRIYSWTTTQRPDIFLEATLRDGEKIRRVFAAKYRIDMNGNKKWPKRGIDTVPDDAINQMHRYRDSLIYLSKAEEDGSADKSRPIIGAFALYPGWV